jgi:hypothetical protein
MRVVARVNFHSFRQRTPRPIGFLRTFVQLHAEKIFNEIAQAELPFAQKPRGEHRVKNRGRTELMMLFEQAQIVIRRVKNQFAAVEHVEQRVEVDFRERVHEFVAVGGADLDEADFFGIGVEAVGFGVEREPVGGAEFGQQRRQFCISINHVAQVWQNARQKKRLRKLARLLERVSSMLNLQAGSSQCAHYLMQ